MIIKSQHYPEFDGLRAIMAWWVVIGHVANRIGFQYDRDLPLYWKVLLLTNVPVNIFIALSGFVVFALLSKENTSYSAFIIGRLFRVYPVYIFCLIFGIFLLNYRMDMMLADQYISRDRITSAIYLFDQINSNYLMHVLSHIALLHGIVADQWAYGVGHSFIGPAWSLSLEWQFYLIAPLLFNSISKNKKVFVLIVACIFACALYSKSMALTFSYGSFLPTNFIFFIVGFASFYFYTKQFDKFILCSVVVVSFIPLVSDIKTTTFSILLWISIVFLIVGLNKENSKLAIFSKYNFLRSELLCYLGSISYSTYLIHVFVIDILIALVWWFNVPYRSVEAFGLLLLPSVMVTLAVSIYVNKLIERPFIEFGRKYRVAVRRRYVC